MVPFTLELTITDAHSAAKLFAIFFSRAVVSPLNLEAVACEIREAIVKGCNRPDYEQYVQALHDGMDDLVRRGQL